MCIHCYNIHFRQLQWWPRSVNCEKPWDWREIRSVSPMFTTCTYCTFHDSDNVTLLDITWLAHNVTWPWHDWHRPHDHHVNVTWPSHDCHTMSHDHHMTVTWLVLCSVRRLRWWLAGLKKRLAQLKLSVREPQRQESGNVEWAHVVYADVVIVSETCVRGCRFSCMLKHGFCIVHTNTKIVRLVQFTGHLPASCHQ